MCFLRIVFTFYLFLIVSFRLIISILDQRVFLNHWCERIFEKLVLCCASFSRRYQSSRTFSNISLKSDVSLTTSCDSQIEISLLELLKIFNYALDFHLFQRILCLFKQDFETFNLSSSLQSLLPPLHFLAFALCKGIFCFIKFQQH